MVLPLEISRSLKEPFGKLVLDEDITKKKIKNYIMDCPLLATVGDATTSKLLSFGIIPDLSIVDGRERRKPIDSAKIACLMLDRDQKKLSYMRCSNKPGSVSRRAITTIKHALKKPFPVRVFVYGEEDMLALPLFVMAPDGSVVIYGQPLKGMVIVKVHKDIRQKAQDLISKLAALG